MDDFYMNMSDFDDDAELDIVDEEKLKVLDKIEEYTKLTRDSVKFQEKDEYDTNFRILSSYISMMVDLSQLAQKTEVVEDDEGNETTRELTDDEIYERIQEIEKHVEEISHQTLRDVDSDDGEEITLDDIAPKEKPSNTDDGSLDF